MASLVLVNRFVGIDGLQVGLCKFKNKDMNEWVEEPWMIYAGNHSKYTEYGLHGYNDGVKGNKNVELSMS